MIYKLIDQLVDTFINVLLGFLGIQTTPPKKKKK